MNTIRTISDVLRDKADETKRGSPSSRIGGTSSSRMAGSTRRRWRLRLGWLKPASAPAIA